MYWFMHRGLECHCRYFFAKRRVETWQLGSHHRWGRKATTGDWWGLSSQCSILSFIACLLNLESTKSTQDKGKGNISEGFEIWNVGCVLETLQEVDDEDLEDQMAFGWMGVSRWQKTVSCADSNLLATAVWYKATAQSSFGLMEKCQRLFTCFFNTFRYFDAWNTWQHCRHTLRDTWILPKKIIQIHRFAPFFSS